MALLSCAWQLGSCPWFQNRFARCSLAQERVACSWALPSLASPASHGNERGVAIAPLVVRKLLAAAVVVDVVVSLVAQQKRTQRIAIDNWRRAPASRFSFRSMVFDRFSVLVSTDASTLHFRIAPVFLLSGFFCKEARFRGWSVFGRWQPNCRIPSRPVLLRAPNDRMKQTAKM